MFLARRVLLEDKFQSKLNQAFWRGNTGSYGTRNYTETVPGRSSVVTVSWHIEIRVIEYVEKLRPELDAESFRDLGSLENSEVKVVDARPAEDRINPSFGSEPPLRRRCKAIGVEPVGDVAAASFQVATGNDIRPDIGDAQTGTFQSS